MNGSSLLSAYCKYSSQHVVTKVRYNWQTNTPVTSLCRKYQAPHYSLCKNLVVDIRPQADAVKVHYWDGDTSVHSQKRYSRVSWTPQVHDSLVRAPINSLDVISKLKLYLITEVLFTLSLPSKSAYFTTVPPTTMPRTTNLGRRILRQRVLVGVGGERLYDEQCIGRGYSVSEGRGTGGLSARSLIINDDYLAIYEPSVSSYQIQNKWRGLRTRIMERLNSYQ